MLVCVVWTYLWRRARFFYIHVIDNNTNCTSVVTGPVTYTRRDHEKLVTPQPEPMIMVRMLVLVSVLNARWGKVPPRHYCIIANPVVR